MSDLFAEIGHFLAIVVGSALGTLIALAVVAFLAYSWFFR